MRTELLYALAAVVWLTVVLQEALRRQRAGKVLFDLGPNKFAVLRTVVGVVAAALGLGFLVLNPRENLFRGIAHLLWGAWYLLMATRHIQICESGIFSQRKLIPWREIAAFDLHHDGILRLTLSRPNHKIVGCPVPPSARDTVTHILASRLPTS